MFPALVWAFSGTPLAVLTGQLVCEHVDVLDARVCAEQLSTLRGECLADTPRQGRVSPLIREAALAGPEAPEWRSRAASSVPLPPGAGTELDLDGVAQLRDRFGPPALRRDLHLWTVDRDREPPSQRLPASGSPDDWRMRRTRMTPHTPKPARTTVFTTRVMCYLHLDG